MRTKIRWNEYLYPENFLSLLRIPLAVFFVIFAAHQKVMLSILVLAAITDILDGWMARTYKRSSHRGEFLDPFADKIFYGTTAITLFYKQQIPWMLLPIFLLREILIIGGMIGKKKGREIKHYKAMSWGKITTVIQWCTLLTLIVIPAYARIGILIAGLTGIQAARGYQRRIA